MSIQWRSPRSQSRPLLQPSAALLAEPAFLRALCIERKRAERSKKPLILMLLQYRTTSAEREGDEFFEKTASAIVSSIRETDIVGWHTEDRVLGVIFAELGNADRQLALTALGVKITTVLQSTLGPDQLNRLNIVFHYFPEERGDGDHGDSTTPKTTPLYPDLAQREEAKKCSRALKRAIDVLGSAVALVVFSPLLFVAAVAIKLSSPGPVLFRQQRIGRHGVPFTFLKFRSMYVRNDTQRHKDFVTQFIGGHTPSSGENDLAVYKITDDPRVTRIGRFLRKTSLDELPQLLNVLRGEMSLVGPRPPIPYELEAYETWHRRRVLEAKPGITGLWQVSGRSRLRFDDMVRLDLQYAEQWSLWLDLQILLRTPRAVLSGEGAY